MNKLLTILFLSTIVLSYYSSVKAQNVTIPDPNFKAYLVGNSAINTNGDSEIQFSEASAYSGALDVRYQNISDMKGLEAFTSLVELDFSDNSLITLDVSSNTALLELYCSRNQLSNLNVSGNTILQTLHCSDNQLLNLDVSSNAALTDLSCFSNQLSSLEVRNNANLSTLVCENNPLGSLDVSMNTDLLYLYCSQTQLSNLDVRFNTNILHLFCSTNQLSNLDISYNTVLTNLSCGSNQLNNLDVTKNIALRQLYCPNNHLSMLDVSQNKALNYLWCNSNQLSSLDIRNGNNDKLTLFNAFDNPPLNCVSVDDVAYAIANWTSVDTGVVFSTDGCNVYIPDPNFKAILVANSSINTNLDSDIQYSEAEAFAGRIEVINQSIYDLTGLEAFVSLTELMCQRNSINSLNVSNNTALTFLDCSTNIISSLNINNNKELLYLHCGDNLITSLDINNNPALETLYCYSNSITSLDTKFNTEIRNLHCGDNLITSLDLSSNSNLVKLMCYNNDLGSIDLISNPLISYLSCFNTGISSLNVGLNPALETLNCYSNSLTSLELSDNNLLMELYCHDNLLTDLDLGNNNLLKILNCDNNQLNQLDVSSNPALEILACTNNSLSNLDITKNKELTFILCSNNSISNLDLGSNLRLTNLNCSNNSISALNLVKNNELTSVRCTDNLLETLDVRNGNNISISFFEAFNNPNLSCISVSDVAFAEANWTEIDDGVGFTTDCDAPVYIPDVNFKAYLVSNSEINTNGDDEIQYSEAMTFTGDIVVNSLGIIELTGIEAFINIISLSCNDNSLAILDVTTNTELSFLSCSENLLTSLDVGNNIALIYLNCSSNQLSSMEVNSNSALTLLDCGNNLLNSLDVSANTALTRLYFYTNSIASVDLSTNTALTHLRCNENSLTSLDISNNTTLTNLYCDNNALNNLDVSMNTALSTLRCSDNLLASLNVSLNTSLTDLICSNNSLSTIDISNNASLFSFYCDGNLLSNLDLSGNSSLAYLNCSNNSLTSLDVSTNLSLHLLYCFNNSITDLDLAINTALGLLVCKENSLSNLDMRNGKNSDMIVFDVINNPDLTCISVSDVDYATNNWTNIDPGVSFNSDCRYQEISFDALEDKTYGDADFSLNASATSGLAVNYTSSNTSVATISGNSVTIIGAGTTTITASQGGDANYDPATEILQVLTVSKAMLIVTAENKDKTYGESNPTLTMTYSGFVTGDDSSVLDVSPLASTSATETSPVDSYNIVVSGGEDADYNFTYADGVLEINKATITAKAEDKDKMYGEANPTLTMKYSGFVTGDDASVLDVSPLASTSATETSPVDSYDIVVSSGEDANYNFTYVDGILTINKASQTITFNPIEDQMFEDQSVALSAISSAELDVVFVVLNGPVTLSGNILSFIGPGSVTVEALQEGDANYHVADPIQQSFEINAITGLTDQLVDFHTVYPNPTSDFLSLYIGELVIEKMQLFNVEGQLVREFNSNMRVLDLQNVINGIYLLRISTAEKVLHQRIVKN